MPLNGVCLLVVDVCTSVVVSGFWFLAWCLLFRLLFVIRNWFDVACCVFICWLLIGVCCLSWCVVHGLVIVVRCLLFVVCFPLFCVACSLPCGVCGLLFVICCFLFLFRCWSLLFIV